MSDKDIGVVTQADGFFYVEWEGEPCPFCGGKAVSGKSPEGHFFAGCDDPDCIAHMLAYDFVTVDHARAAWNTRAQPHAGEGVKERARELLADAVGMPVKDLAECALDPMDTVLTSFALRAIEAALTPKPREDQVEAVARAIEALRPFATFADAYDASVSDDQLINQTADGRCLYLGELRAARAALSASTLNAGVRDEVLEEAAKVADRSPYACPCSIDIRALKSGAGHD